MVSDSSSLPVVCLLGPTASGKTEIAIQLVDRFAFEIINVDSAQVYRQMDIGTAKPNADVLRRAPHALIDIVDPWQHYSVAMFLQDADKEISRIHSQRKIPLLVGGTMLYFRALWHGLSDLPKSDPDVRGRLNDYASTHGPDALYSRLQQIDPESAARIHCNDPQRILRALEVYELSGKTLSGLQNQRSRSNSYHFFNIGLFPQDRKRLHERIAERFLKMLAAGFETEVRSLMELPQMNSQLPSMRSVGYRQMWQYLAGEIDESELQNRAVAATRQLAKRQITWLRGMDNCQLMDPFSESVMLEDRVLSDSLLKWIETQHEYLR